MTLDQSHAIDPLIEEIVREATTQFTGRGLNAGNSEKSIQSAIAITLMHYEDLKLSDAENEEIRFRFKMQTTHPRKISTEELEANSHSDDSIDGSWFDRIDSFPKWERIRDNWTRGHSSARMHENAIGNIDKYSSHIIGNSYNPKADPYLWKGLVVGNVQSGKTATYTGLIGKAMDVGYRIILVMSGRMNSLRYQTEARITYHVAGAPNDEKSIAFDESVWPITKLDLEGDFGGTPLPSSYPQSAPR